MPEESQLALHDLPADTWLAGLGIKAVPGRNGAATAHSVGHCPSTLQMAQPHHAAIDAQPQHDLSHAAHVPALSGAGVAAAATKCQLLMLLLAKAGGSSLQGYDGSPLSTQDTLLLLRKVHHGLGRLLPGIECPPADEVIGAWSSTDMVPTGQAPRDRNRRAGQTIGHWSGAAARTNTTDGDCSTVQPFGHGRGAMFGNNCPGCCRTSIAIT